MGAGLNRSVRVRVSEGNEGNSLWNEKAEFYLYLVFRVLTASWGASAREEMKELRYVAQFLLLFISFRLQLWIIHSNLANYSYLNCRAPLDQEVSLV